MSFSYRIDQLTGGMVRNLAMTQRQQQKTTAALSSGFKINSAGDDAAGLQISQNLEAQIRGEKKAQENIQTMLNLLNATESLVSNVRDQFSRIRDLVVASMNDTNGTQQLTAIKSEIDQLIGSAIQMGRNFKFNGKAYFSDKFGHILDANPPATFLAQIGSEADSNSQMIFNVVGPSPLLNGYNGDLFNLRADRFVASSAGLLGVATFRAMVTFGTADYDGPGGAAHDAANGTEILLRRKTDISTQLSRQESIVFVDNMLNFFNNDILGNIGSYTNRLEAALANSQLKVENQMAAQARITNTDYATASVEAVRQNILQQSTISLMNQAKISHRSVINLIQQSGQVL